MNEIIKINAWLHDHTWLDEYRLALDAQGIRYLYEFEPLDYEHIFYFQSGDDRLKATLLE